MKRSLSLIRTSLLLLGLAAFFLAGQAGARGPLVCAGLPACSATVAANCYDFHPHLAAFDKPATCCAFAPEQGGACLEPSLSADLFHPRKRTSRELFAQLPLPASVPKLPVPALPQFLAAAGIDQPLPVPHPALAHLRTVVLLV